MLGPFRAARARFRSADALALGALFAFAACATPASGPGGATTRVGRAWEFTVTGSAVQPELEWEGDVYPSDEGQWAIISIAVDQVAGGSGPPTGANFELVDADGKRYQTSRKPEAVGFAQARGLAAAGSVPAPGQRTEAVLVFEVPENIRSPRLVLKPAAGGG